MAVTSFSQLDLSKRYTYADYLTWQFDEMVELIRGKVFKMSPAPLSEHQMVSMQLVLSIGHFFSKKKCHVFDAPFDVRLPTKGAADKDVMTVCQPDICVICDVSKLDRRGCNGAPDLIVEILSKSTAEKDLKIKLGLYEEAGVQEYWIATPQAKSIHLYAMEDGKYQLKHVYTESETIQSVLFPALSISMKGIFQGVDMFD